MTFRDALHWGKRTLNAAGIPDGDWDAECLLLFATGCDRTGLLLNGNKELPESQEADYRALIKKREERVPLQYLTGSQEFMGLPFYVNQHVLIPRQDTECLVERVLKELEEFKEMKGQENKVQLLDMCTGSGCIGISLAKLSDCEVVCADISPEALLVAEKNSIQNKAEVTFVESDLFAHITGHFDVIVSNPPYITAEEMKELMPEVRLFEPERALYGKEDGLYFYREIIKEAPQYLKENGRLFFEIGCRQGSAVAGIMEQAGFRNVEIEKDLAGLDRIVYGRI